MPVDGVLLPWGGEQLQLLLFDLHILLLQIQSMPLKLPQPVA